MARGVDSYGRKLGPLQRAIFKSITEFRELFRLPNWPVFFIEVDEPPISSEDAPFDDVEAVAQIHTRPYDNEVVINYHKDLPIPWVRRIICHEMVHWLMTDVDLLVGDLLNGYPTGPARDVLKEHYDQTKEQFVEAVARAIIQPDDQAPREWPPDAGLCPACAEEKKI